MTPSQIIVLATPVFFLLIATEFAWRLARRHNTDRSAISNQRRSPPTKESLNNLSASAIRERA
jgi:cytochrome c-type biogenesis protein CcmH/NrfF